MSLNKIERIVNDETPNFQIRNFYYDSSDLTMRNGNYIPNTTDDEKTNTSTMHASIANNCSNLLDSEDQITGLINENDSDYQLYKNSDLYKKSPENVRNLNAFIWYYSTNRLNNNSTVKANGYNKYDSFKTDNPNLDQQIKNLSCQVLSNKAVYTELNDESDLFPGLASILSVVNVDNIDTITTHKDGTGNKLVGYNKIICWIVIIISLYFTIVGSISLMRYIYKFTGVNTFMTKTSITSYIIGIIVSVILMYFLLNIYTTVNTSIFDTNENKYMFVSPPNNNLETFTCETDSNIGGCISTRYGCCPDGVTAKSSPDDPCTDTPCPPASEETVPCIIPESWNYQEEEECKKAETGEETGETSEETNKPIDNYNCEKTLYGCCPNGVDAKFNEPGTNCDDLTRPSMPSWMVLIFMCFVIALLFIAIGLTNKLAKGKVKTVIVFVLYLMLITSYIYVLYNATNTANNVSNSVSLERDANSCYNINYVTNASGLGIQYAWILGSVIVFVVLFLLFKLKANQGSSVGSGLGFILPLLMLGLTSMLFMGVYLWSKYPGPLLGLIFMFRWVFVLICNIIYKACYGKKFMNPESSGSFIVNLMAFLYDAPIEYFQELFNPKGQLYRPVYYENILSPDDRYVNPKNLIDFSEGKGLTIPSGMPWEFPGIKIIKLLTLLFYTKICKNKDGQPDLSSLIPTIDEYKERVMSNVGTNASTFSPFVNFGYFFKQLFSSI